MRLTAISTISLVLLSTSAYSETRDERITAAHEYIYLSMELFDIPDEIETLWRPLIDQVEASGIYVSDAQKSKIQALYLEVYTDPITELAYNQAATIADVMTMEEIQYLTEIYSSPLGRSTMAKLPKLIETQQLQFTVINKTIVPQLMTHVFSILGI